HRAGPGLLPARHPAQPPRRPAPDHHRCQSPGMGADRAGVRRSARARPEAGERRVIRIGNASGFYGDRFAAMREMLTGGELDYLTGDYLAELTMLILGRQRMADPTAGYAKTFLRQLEECLGLAVDRGVRIV